MRKVCFGQIDEIQDSLSLLVVPAVFVGQDDPEFMFYLKYHPELDGLVAAGVEVSHMPYLRYRLGLVPGESSMLQVSGFP